MLPAYQKTKKSKFCHESVIFVQKCQLSILLSNLFIRQTTLKSWTAQKHAVEGFAINYSRI